MASITYGRKLLMKVDENNKNLNNGYDDFFENYPFREPKVYLDRTCESYNP